MALAVPASVTEKDAPNLVQDAGFESGKAVKWERWGDASVADSNARTGKFSGVSAPIRKCRESAGLKM